MVGPPAILPNEEGSHFPGNLPRVHFQHLVGHAVPRETGFDRRPAVASHPAGSVEVGEKCSQAPAYRIRANPMTEYHGCWERERQGFRLESKT